MSSGDHDVASVPLTRDQVLDELEFLATVEHALIVECLSVCYALGYDLDAAEGGATTDQGRDTAQAASVLAQSEMFHLKNVNSGLIAAGRSAQLGRAPSISSDSVPAIPLDPPSLAQLQQLITRERAIGSAVDERYAKLVPAVTSDPVFDGDVLTELQSVIVDQGQKHAAAFTAMTDSLSGLTPDDYLRATRRDGTDAFEGRLLDVSDGNYSLVVRALNYQFGQSADAFTPALFMDLAESAMEALDNINRLLVQRGLLPPFTSP